MGIFTEILQHYGIFPQAIEEVTDRLYKVKAEGRQYALKRSKMDAGELKNWLSVYHTAAGKHLHEIIPVYMTNQGELYVEMEGEHYYLMPWVGGNSRYTDENWVQSFYRQIASIHVQTKSLYELNKDEMRRNFESYNKRCLEDEQRLIAWMDRLEKVHYPSPFELQILTYYRDLRSSLVRSQRLAEQIIVLAESETSWGVSLTHGRLEPEHIFQHYIINWERATYKHAIDDLVDILHYEAAREPQNYEYFLEAFPAYLEENPLSRLERSLLFLYLIYPGECLQFIESYLQSSERPEHQLQLSMEFEKAYRKVMAGLRFETKMEKFAREKVQKKS